MLRIFQRYVFRELFSNMQSLFIPNLYVGDKEDIEELLQEHLKWVTEYLCSLVFVLLWSYVCFSEKFEEVCDVCQRKYTTTLLQGRKKYTIISINRTKFLDPNLKSKCKIKIPIHAISCILHWREIQTHLILIFPTSLLKTLSSLKIFSDNSN